jgi:hypothetical protein
MQKFEVGVVIDVNGQRIDTIIEVTAKDRYAAVTTAMATVAMSTDTQFVVVKP